MLLKSILVLTLLGWGGSDRIGERWWPRLTDHGNGGLLIEAVLDTDSKEFVLHEPVLLNLRIKNTCKAPVKVDLGPNGRGDLAFTLTLPSGNRSDLPKLNQQGLGGFVGGGAIEIEPGETVVRKLVLEEWTGDLDTGTFSVRVRIPTVATKTCPQQFVETPDLKFHVGGSDQDRLKNVASRAFDIITEYKTFDDAATAARALCYITDPVAIPTQEKALTSVVGVDTIMIDTLRQIGTSQSAEVLVNALKAKPSAEWASVAKWSLSVIRSNTTDNALKQRITAFLLSQ